MIRTISFVVDCKDQDEFTKIYLSIDDMWVEQVKSMSWKEGDHITVPSKQSTRYENVSDKANRYEKVSDNSSMPTKIEEAD